MEILTRREQNVFDGCITLPEKVLDSSTNHNPSLHSVTCILPNEDLTAYSSRQKYGFHTSDVYSSTSLKSEFETCLKIPYLRLARHTSPPLSLYSRPRPTKQQAYHTIRSPRIVRSPHLTHPSIETLSVLLCWKPYY